MPEFWATEVKPGKPAEWFPEEPSQLVVRNAALGTKVVKGERNILQAQVGDTKTILCSLVGGNIEQATLDLVSSQPIVFTLLEGSSSIYLSGNEAIDGDSDSDDMFGMLGGSDSDDDMMEMGGDSDASSSSGSEAPQLIPAGKKSGVKIKEIKGDEDALLNSSSDDDSSANSAEGSSSSSLEEKDVKGKGGMTSSAMKRKDSTGSDGGRKRKDSTGSDGGRKRKDSTGSDGGSAKKKAKKDTKPSGGRNTTSKKTYKCDKCDKGFKAESGLEMHLKAKHS